MEKNEFYKLVLLLRDTQKENAHRKLSIDELVSQWQIEFLVDDELLRHSSEKSKVSDFSASFDSFAHVYCAN